LRVRYAEIDGQKVVFNAHYLTYFDTAVTEYFRWLPFDILGYPERTGMDVHTVRTVVEYKAPIHLDEEIEVWTRVDRIGRSSLTFALEIHPRGAEDLRASGEVVWVNALAGEHRSTPLPDDLVALIRYREGLKES
jgi:acyl-CoA thioester hydrolase